MTKKLTSLAIFLFILNASLYSQHMMNVKFSDPENVKNCLVPGGNKECFFNEKGKCGYNSGLADLKKFRRMNLKASEFISGDFTVEFSFNIKQMDHWNGLQLILKSPVKGWSVQFQRNQLKKGDQKLSLASNVNGKKASSSIKENARKGIMKIVRKGDKLSFFFKAGKGKMKEVFEPLTVDKEPVSVNINCWSPPVSNSIIEFRNFSMNYQEAVSEESITTAFAPLYLPHQKISGTEFGKIELLWREEADVSEDGTVKIQPGGRAVWAMQGPLNFIGQKLKWKSSGHLKVSVTQPGTAETIELGETLLWDQVEKKTLNVPAERQLSLGDFITRYTEPRRWKYTSQTSNNIFFVTFTSANDKEITVKDLALHGRPLQMIFPFKAVAKTKATTLKDKNYTLLKWDAPESSKKWFKGKSPFEPGRNYTLNNIPFVASTTVLNPSCSSLEITTDANAKAGIINIAHVAGPGYEKDDSKLGAYLIVFEDGTTETIFAQLRWNCGVFNVDYMPRGKGDFTWWGPAGFTRGAIHYMPIGIGIKWQAVYTASYMNPHPEKKIKSIIAYQFPGENRTLAVIGITLTPPENAKIGLVEPALADITPDKPIRVSVMRWTPIPAAKSGEQTCPLKMAKTERSVTIADMKLNSSGNFIYGSKVIKPAASFMQPGPIRLTCDGVSSSLLGWMPTPASTPKVSYLTMIAGGAESGAQFERMRRLAYDAVKIHIGWSDKDEPAPGKYDWSVWYPRLERIKKSSGLKIEFRNNFRRGPKWLDEKTGRLFSMVDGKEVADKKRVDLADPGFRKAIVDYYREIGRLASEYPDVISINANYGVRSGIINKNRIYYGKAQLAAFQKYMEKNFTLKEINEKTLMGFKDYKQITPQKVLDDNSDFLLTEYVRHYDSLICSLLWEVSRAIRENSKAHLTFNHAFEPGERGFTGLCLNEYLKISRDLGPGSPFHETSDRYCLSFTKWLTAKSLNLQYGDEGNQNPPTYEHNILAYMWMAWMQCWDSLYCQWWGGRPGSQNIAWIKPYYHLLYNAEYMPDPVSISYSFESAPHESRQLMAKSLHGTTLGHYGMANTLLASNINPKNYMMDDFPDLDKNASKLMIDDSCRFISKEYADRLEKHIRNGGVYIINNQTDKLNNYAFQKRFGITIHENGMPSGDGITVMNPGAFKIPTVSVKNIGDGKLVIMDKEFWTDFDPSAPPAYYTFMRQLFSKLGEFKPLVFSSIPGVYVAPYRAENGDVLLYVLNITAGPHDVELKLSTDALKAKEALDLESGTKCAISIDKDAYNTVKVGILPLSAKIIRFVK